MELTKPKLADFKSPGEFDEALNRWMSTVGREIGRLRSRGFRKE
jgi:hypothetical protein